MWVGFHSQLGAQATEQARARAGKRKLGSLAKCDAHNSPACWAVWRTNAQPSTTFPHRFVFHLPRRGCNIKACQPAWLPVRVSVCPCSADGCTACTRPLSHTHTHVHTAPDATCPPAQNRAQRNQALLENRDRAHARAPVCVCVQNACARKLITMCRSTGRSTGRSNGRTQRPSLLRALCNPPSKFNIFAALRLGGVWGRASTHRAKYDDVSPQFAILTSGRNAVHACAYSILRV